MKKLIFSMLFLVGLSSVCIAQNKAKSPANKLKIEADGLFVSTTEDDLENMLEVAAKLDKMPNNKACTVELIGTVNKNGTEYKVSAKTQKITCTEAAKAAQDALLEAKAAIAAN